MRLNTKLVLIFSVIMIAALLLFSSYAATASIKGANAYTQARFVNMSTAITRDIELDISMMKATLEELSKNTSFMAALNQFVRDDSDDSKVGIAAKALAEHQMLQSPLVNQHYRVAFISQNGQYISSRKEDKTFSSFSPRMFEMPVKSFQIPGEVKNKYFLLSPHNDIFPSSGALKVYSITQELYYHEASLGYLSVMNNYSNLEHIMQFVDNNSAVEVQLVLDNGVLFFSSKNSSRSYKKDMEIGKLVEWVDTVSGESLDVLHTYIQRAGMHLYIAQDSSISAQNNKAIRVDLIKRAALISIPTIILISFVSVRLTSSIRKFTKKVSQVPIEKVLLNDYSASDPFYETVTSPRDKEIHELENVYKNMMLRLRESTINELASREGTLQAQLNALQTQINPHFIYNTLNIISAKSMESGNFEIIEICDQFACMLRYSTDVRSKTATMSEEIENVRNYLNLSKARYEENLQFTIDVPEDLFKIELPKLTLQPIVENAITHGYNGRNIKRELSIIGHISNNTLILEIHDNGTGFPEEMLINLQQRIDDVEHGKVKIENTSRHIGLINTALRLYYYSKGTMKMSIYNDKGAVVRLTMPINNEKTDK